MCGAPGNWQEMLNRDRNRGRERAWRQWERREYNVYGFGAEQAITAGAEYERKRPVRDASLESDVAVPGLQAVITGVAVGLAGGTASAVFGWPKPWLIALGLVGGTTALTWLVLLRAHRDLLWEIERVIGTDLDRDGDVGKPDQRAVVGEPEPRVTRVEITDRDNKRIRYVDLPLSDGEIERVARAVLVAKGSFSQRGLSDILSQEQYSETYDSMLEGGLLRYKGKSARAGVELTGAGRAFLEQYLD
jgi:hypothetical protein